MGATKGDVRSLENSSNDTLSRIKSLAGILGHMSLCLNSFTGIGQMIP